MTAQQQYNSQIPVQTQSTARGANYCQFLQIGLIRLAERPAHFADIISMFEILIKFIPIAKGAKVDSAQLLDHGQMGDR